MKYSVWSNYFTNKSPEEAVDLFLKHGFTYGELADEHGAILLKRGDVQKVGRAFREYCEKRGFTYLQGHLKLNADICALNREEEIEELKEWIDLYDAIGIKNMVIHPGGDRVNYHLIYRTFDELLPLRVDALKRLCDHIGDRDINLCLENLFEEYEGVNYPQVVTYEEFEKIIDAVNDPHLAICFDTGHYNIFYHDHETFINKAKDHLKALHIADNEGYNDMHLMPYERGTINWPKVIRALKATRYDGLFNLEIPGESRCPLALQEAKIDYIHTLCEYLISIE